MKQQLKRKPQKLHDQEISPPNKQILGEDEIKPRQQRSTRKHQLSKTEDSVFDFQNDQYEEPFPKMSKKRRGFQKRIGLNQQSYDEEEDSQGINYGPEDEQLRRKRVKKNIHNSKREIDSSNSDEEQISSESYHDLDDYESESNYDFCFRCKKLGQLIFCDSCFRSYHATCVGLKKNPSGPWDCPSCLYTVQSLCPICSIDCLIQQQNVKDFESAMQQELQISQGLANCSKCNILIHISCIINSGLPVECLLDSPINRKYFNSLELQQVVDQTIIEQKFNLRSECIKLMLEIIQQGKNLFYLCNRCLEVFGVGQVLAHVKHILLQEDGTKRKDLYYLTLLEQSSFLHSHYITQKLLSQINARKFKNYTEKYDTDHDEDENLNAQDEEIVEYLEIERVVGCKRVGKWKRMSWKQILVNFEQQDQDQIIGCYGSRDNLKILIKWARLFYDQCTWEDSYLLQKYRKEMKQYFYLKVLEESLGSTQFVIEKREYLQKLDQEELVWDKKGPVHKDIMPQPYWIRGGQLHGFQLEGLNWFKQSYQKKNNVILADEMGLGKTIQTISFLNSLTYDNICNGPFLIVAPATTLYNWLKEFQKWAAQLNVVVYTGNSESREMIRQLEFYFKHSMPRQCKFDVLITSYDTAINDSSCLRRIQWEVLVVDEAHRLKNAHSKFFKVSSMLQTKHKILLTGTPLQNNILELINLIEFIAPQKAKQLKNLDYLKMLLNTGQDQQGFGLSDEDRKGSLAELTRLLQPHILRRTKADVNLQVPEMEEIIVKLCLTDTQKFLYKNVLLKNYQNLRILDSKTKNVASANLLNILMSLRLVCNHPYLFLYKRKFEIEEENWLNIISQSNKLKFLDRVIPKLIEMNHKMLIFSQFTMMLDLVQEFINRRGWASERLDGNTGIMERQKIIDSFNRQDSKTQIFLLSTRAGGLGINLTSADTIIFTDSDFNPYRDLQAISRAHRMGQSRAVKVFRLVSKYTAEERIIEIATKKLLLEEIIINPINKLKKDDFSNLFKNSTWELFNKNLEEKDQEFTDEQINVLLQRRSATECIASNLKLNVQKNDLNDYYLSGFKFSSCNFEKTLEDQENEKIDTANKDKYWDTLLDGEARIRTEKDINELGKGKRLKKQYQPNYQDDVVYNNNNNNNNNNPSEYSPSPIQQQSESENPAEPQVDEQMIKFKIELKPLSERMQRIFDKEQAIIHFFQTNVLQNCELAQLNDLSFEENCNLVVYSFSILHRIDFLDFILHFGIEFETIDIFLTHLINHKPETFKGDLKPQYEEFKKYIKEFYAILLDGEYLAEKSNIVFCGTNKFDVMQRICGLSCLKRKYLYYIKRPEKYVVKHEGYVRVKATKIDGQVIHHQSAWTNYDDFILSKAILEKGFGNWKQMFEDNTFWNYPNDNIPIWYKLFNKFNDDTLEELQNTNNNIILAQEYLADMLRLKAMQIMNFLVESDDFS